MLCQLEAMAEAVKRNLHNNSNNKSKKSRNETIRSVLETYLKQRNYLTSDKFRKTDLVLSQDVDEKIMSALVEDEVSKCNSFRYSNVFGVTNNPNQVDQQFSKLKTFIEAQISIVKKELEALLPPLMCHLYIEMLKGKDNGPAIDFLKKFANIVAPVANTSSPPNHKINGSSIVAVSNEESTPGLANGTPQIVFLNENIVTNDSENHSTRNAFKELIEVLSTTIRIQDIETKPLIVDFRSNKYPVKISTYSSYLLKKYLAQHGHILILQIFQLWFHFDLTIDEVNDDIEFDDDEFSNILLNQEDHNDLMYSLTLHENTYKSLMNSSAICNETVNYNLLDNSLTDEIQVIANTNDVPINSTSNNNNTTTNCNSLTMNNNTNNKNNDTVTNLDNNTNVDDITSVDNSNTNYDSITNIDNRFNFNNTNQIQLNDISNLDYNCTAFEVNFTNVSKIDGFGDLNVNISRTTFDDVITDFNEITCNENKTSLDDASRSFADAESIVNSTANMQNLDNITNIENIPDIDNITDIAAIDNLTNIDYNTSIGDNMENIDYSTTEKSSININNTTTATTITTTTGINECTGGKSENLTNNENTGNIENINVDFNTNFDEITENNLNNIESTLNTKNATGIDDKKIKDFTNLKDATNINDKTNTADTSTGIIDSITNVDDLPIIENINFNTSIENNSNVPNIIDINYKSNVDPIINLDYDNVEDLTNIDLPNITIDSNTIDDLRKKTDFLTASQKKLDKFKTSIAKLNKYQLPVRVLNIVNSDNSLSAASVDPHECHIAGAFENSTICLWSMNKSIYSGRKPYLTYDRKLCDFSVANCDLSENESSSSDDECRNKRRHINSKRRITKRERWRQFMEKRSEENTFSETGGVVLRGHNKGVTDVLFLKHSPLLMSVSKDLTMRAWKASDYTCGAVYRGHNHPIWCVAESPTGLYLATGSRDSTARLWTTDRQYPLQIYVGHSQDVDTVAFHPNGNYLATGSTDLSVRMWCVTSGKLLRVFTECRLPLNSVKFSPNGKYLAAASEETCVRIFDIAAGTQLCELKDHSTSVTSISWSADSNHIISSCKDGTIRLWNIQKLDNYFSSFKIQANAPSTSTSTAHTQHTTSTKCNLLMSYGTNCKRLIKAHYNLNNTITCIGNN